MTEEVNFDFHNSPGRTKDLGIQHENAVHITFRDIQTSYLETKVFLDPTVEVVVKVDLNPLRHEKDGGRPRGQVRSETDRPLTPCELVVLPWRELCLRAPVSLDRLHGAFTRERTGRALKTDGRTERGRGFSQRVRVCV